MSDIPANPDTPWEFYPDDDIRQSQPVGAEDAAMHIVTETSPSPDVPEPVPDVIVHYMEDEHPEVSDLSEPPPDDETTPEVQDLLIRQHYLPSEGDRENED